MANRIISSFRNVRVVLAALGHTTNSITIANADDAKAYIVGVRAGNGAGWSSWVNSSEVPKATQ